MTFAKRNKALDRAKQAYNNYYTSRKVEEFAKNFKGSFKGLNNYMKSKDFEEPIKSSRRLK